MWANCKETKEAHSEKKVLYIDADPRFKNIKKFDS
jgi:hypothetical protein